MQAQHSDPGVVFHTEIQNRQITIIITLCADIPIYSHPRSDRPTIMNMGRPHGPGDAVHKSSMHDTPEVNHNLAWREPHVESGVDCSRLTSCDAVAASRQGCDCVIFSEERRASSRTMPPREVDDSVVRSGGMGERRQSEEKMAIKILL